MIASALFSVLFSVWFFRATQKLDEQRTAELIAQIKLKREADIRHNKQVRADLKK